MQGLEHTKHETLCTACKVQLLLLFVQMQAPMTLAWVKRYEWCD